MLILAGVALNLTVGDNGIFKKAQNAADTWQMAEQNEQSEMEQAGDFIEIYQRGVNTATTVKEAISQDGFYLENTKIKDDLDNEVVIPGYFKLASDSATKVEDGIVIEDLDGNQFVWVPVKTEDEGGATINLSEGGTANVVYQRTDFGKQGGYYKDYSEQLDTKEENSVNLNGGYYIGRYEAGDKEYTMLEKMREDGASQKNTVTIKKNQTPYNWITYENAKLLAENMYKVQNYTKVISKLPSSYAWDTTLDFLQKANYDNEHKNYVTTSPEGNYENSPEFTYTDITGNTNQLGPNKNAIPTGQTIPVSNIYDMGGNLWEYVTEEHASMSCVNRGGAYISCDYTIYPAGRRNGSNGVVTSRDGFRVALFIN